MTIKMFYTNNRTLITFYFFSLFYPFFNNTLLTYSKSYSVTFQPPSHVAMTQTVSNNINGNHGIRNKRSSTIITLNEKAGVVYNRQESNDQQPSSTYNGKRLILIRHGSSTANEFMYRPGNRWGDPTFTDDIAFIDAPLSDKGRRQAMKLQEEFAHYFKNYNDYDDKKCNVQSIDLDERLLVVTSPLTRCMETLIIGVLPNLLDIENTKILVQPLATERVYTASDTGTPVKELRKKYPELDFDSCFDDTNLNADATWWYTNKNDPNDYQEWRPHDKNQYYAVPGEPLDCFNHRMVQLFEWIKSRKEQTIILVCHWGVIRWFTGDEDVKNCEVKDLQFDNMILKNEIFSCL